MVWAALIAITVIPVSILLIIAIRGDDPKARD